MFSGMHVDRCKGFVPAGVIAVLDAQLDCRCHRSGEDEVCSIITWLDCQARIVQVGPAYSEVADT